MLVLFALPSKLIIINQSNVNTTTAHDHDDDVGVGGGIQRCIFYSTISNKGISKNAYLQRLSHQWDITGKSNVGTTHFGPLPLSRQRAEQTVAERSPFSGAHRLLALFQQFHHRNFVVSHP